MVIEAEDRLVRVERACERIHERLGVLEHRLTAIEPRLASGMVSLGYEVRSALDALRSELRSGDTRLGKQGTVYFYWLAALFLGSIAACVMLGVGF